MSTTNLTAGLLGYYEKKLFQQAFGEGWEYEWDYYRSSIYTKLVKSAEGMLPMRSRRGLSDRRTKAYRWLKENEPLVRAIYEREHPRPSEPKPHPVGGKTVTFTRHTPLS